jgi:hypothetical protein
MFIVQATNVTALFATEKVILAPNSRLKNDCKVIKKRKVEKVVQPTRPIS